MAKKSLFTKYRAVLVAVVVALAVISMYSMSDESPVVGDETEQIVSKLENVVAEDIDCIYLGDKPNFGHFGQYDGMVSNEGNDTLTDVKVVVEFFDENGRSVGTHETLIVGESIGPAGNKRFFSFTDEGTLSGEFASCKARVE